MDAKTNYYELSKAKEYQKIIDELLPAVRSGNSISAQNLSYLIDALNKVRRYDESVALGKQHFADVKNNKYALNSLCFAVYMSKVQPHMNEKLIPTETAKTAEWVIEHYPKDPKSFIWVNSLFLCVKFSLAHGDHGKAAAHLSLVKVDQLSNEVKTINVNGKEVAIKSDREKYIKYSMETAMAAGKSDLALQLCEELLKIDPKDVWYQRDKALVLKNLGRNDDAMALYKEILKRKTDWFMWHEAAKLALQSGNRDEAKTFFSRGFGAALSQSSFYSWHLFVDIAEFLKESGEEETALKQLYYVYLTALNDDGNRPQEMLKYFHERKIKVPGDLDVQALKNELRVYHSTNEFSGEKLTGVISRINEGGKSGFISAGDKRYFFMARNFRGKTPKEGTNVTFHVEKHTNLKTGAEEDQAVGVAVIRG